MIAAPSGVRTLVSCPLGGRRRLNAGGRIEGGGFVRQTSAEFLAQWQEFRRRQPGYHTW